jgi:enoyl-CoA hydratase/carnithine racemase
MILCGERVDAATAKAIGLVEQVVPSGGALEAALQLAAKVANQSPTSVTACKALIQGARANPLQQILPVEREAFIDLFDSADQKEGVGAFLQKRKPEWRNG